MNGLPRIPTGHKGKVPPKERINMKRKKLASINGRRIIYSLALLYSDEDDAWFYEPVCDKKNMATLIEALGCAPTKSHDFCDKLWANSKGRPCPLTKAQKKRKAKKEREEQRKLEELENLDFETLSEQLKII